MMVVEIAVTMAVMTAATAAMTAVMTAATVVMTARLKLDGRQIWIDSEP